MKFLCWLHWHKWYPFRRRTVRYPFSTKTFNQHRRKCHRCNRVEFLFQRNDWRKDVSPDLNEVIGEFWHSSEDVL